MRESCSLLIREYTEGVALSGRIDLIMTDLWRDRKAPKGQRLISYNLSGKRTEQQ